MTDKKPGCIQWLTIGGVPVFVHWSILVAGMLLSAFAGFNVDDAIYFAMGFAMLVAIHEAGHAIAAKSFGLKIYDIYVSAMGGTCRTERPRSVWQAVVLTSAGLIAQAVLLVSTVLWIALVGPPTTQFGKCIAASFTFLNVVTFVINLIPRRTSRGWATDGHVLWRLFLHVARNHPNPLPYPVPHDESPVYSSDTRLLSVRTLVPKGFTTGIEILNDATTPMDFVVATMVSHLRVDHDEAVMLMLNVHNRGGIMIPLPWNRATAVSASVAADAAAQGHSLVCRAVDARNRMASS